MPNDPKSELQNRKSEPQTAVARRPQRVRNPDGSITEFNVFSVKEQVRAERDARRKKAGG